MITPKQKKKETIYALDCRGGTYMPASKLGASIYYMAVGWHACSGGAYMSADMLGARIYYMAFGWDACSGGAYMSADTLGARIYYMAVGWHACSGGVHILYGRRLGRLQQGRIYVG